MKEYFYDFLLMIQFLTRLPVKKSLPCDKKNFRDGVAMFPLIGLIVGGIQYLTYYICIKVFPANITAIFIIVVGIFVMGGLHQDGFGDIFDGFFSFKGDKNKIIEIMKDSRIGTFACIALIFDILTKYAAITFIISMNMPLVIIVAPIVSKCSVTLLCLIGKNAKSTGTGNFFVENTSIVHFIISVITTILISIYLIGTNNSIIAILLGFLVTLLFLKLCKNKIGGITGDCLGANNEFVELAVLILFTAMLNR
ncbi:adenosylcobinamide-GDP ribazoletransferase [Clostridium tetanomorphum]|uniref:Adenosylcobinamide-GDP ribazoletransferase n=1 Tax=Clostridium tetanomorphum TaxID=1553 RepID=A0A923J0J2_CLOTT|nr:adenosylcobinamide-GDP ribazoletransferase [Clostridium tetanomorphum]KAJ50330.1 cobalamin synthase [Clostridium tetanomorphum DSM 665]MBC2397779.1 adenosylcobinamide-GDP ribazoletransferase [Clostridium tetanomorphum]MBP1866058.1 adenosylcobinamide-GDP ribazoletransferase [Clostridium tetanomorphum]NRS83263.1 adenosylcobinamide-GDP ribazoletransferase [Clostridium tetanomorphum]NRZ96467.1 adenosylcobinamide-GDP ribazoletransferase [Clostridium tetanomorphum]